MPKSAKISAICQLPRYVQKCTQQQKWQKREHVGEFGKYGENDNFATITNRAKRKAIRGPIKVGDPGEFGKYGENDNFARIANRARKFTNQHEEQEPGEEERIR